jgi:hypothetical protein
MEPHLIDALARGRMCVQFGLESIGVLGEAQSRLGAVFRALAYQLGIAPPRVAALDRAAQHRIAGIDVVVPELGSLVVGMDADHVASFAEELIRRKVEFDSAGLTIPRVGEVPRLKMPFDNDLQWIED